ncbi:MULTISPECIES: prepilin peptidase [Photobacterium]|uniref:Prepilin type IV endopeptidase peptidase domain-containing protein n=1 Tax=Photobacterium ganghwense TaxID=320778 RepID=A0A0J1KAJ1_9GAMM|nr:MULTISPECIES: prepilin peptidase [Photobacterium]KLV11337.1 hypothetical protein ABT57_00835 [Photobacterium ganghwense]MBV1840646.1 prepilin peptidase [Photobacterium ganghwense]PSU08181.1 hypothetical protein C9I92_11635 [Photobacterium ganghwense]QSV14990.1 prepilin peptidase [Photobacterium ganghwense]
MVFIFTFILLLCSLLDIQQRIVSNKLSFLLVLNSISMVVQNKGLIVGSEWSFWSLVFVIILTLPGFIFGVFGGADVKILLSVAIISPLALMLNILLVSFGCFALYWLLFIRDRQQHGPFIPCLLVGVGLSVWLY